MRKITQQEFDAAYEQHQLWLDSRTAQRMNFCECDLEGIVFPPYAELNYAKLNYAKLNYAELNHANLNYAKLNYAELSHANLNYAKLNHAELSHANLNCAKLNHAELNHANLNYAKLNHAELNCANLDFSCLPLWCGSLKMITDRKLCVQIAYHLYDMLKNRNDLADDEKEFMVLLKPYANEMHRTDVPRFE